MKRGVTLTIKELREAQGLTQNDAAHEAGIGQDSWWKLEKGYITNPHRNNLTAIARVLKVTPAQLRAILAAQRGGSATTEK